MEGAQQTPGQVPPAAETDDHKVMVYRFKRFDRGAEISPRHMWGTLEAIAALDGCLPLPETERRVHRKLLDDGFFFEHAASLYVDIDEPKP